jgi:uncharacterized repeat protein (TIGR03803 family)
MSTQPTKKAFSNCLNRHMTLTTRRLCLNLLLALVALQAAPGASQTIEILRSFAGDGDGATPFGGVVRDLAGNLYGTTEFGGKATCASQGYGTVYKLDPTGTKTTLHVFCDTDGANPLAKLTRDASGNLYGTTYSGGSHVCFGGCGTVFKIDSSNRFTVLYRFSGAPDGASPWAGLVADEQGNLYGTTVQGGTVTSAFIGGCGIVFKIDPAGHETVLYRFSCGTDGGAPYSTPYRDSQGNLYGTTFLGGDLIPSCFSGNGCGTVFKLDATGKESVLHAFTGEPDASAPQAGLTYFGGYFYGTSSTGGALGTGAVFKVDRAGNESVLYSFGSNALDGLFMRDPLIHDSAGNLYGTTGILKSTVFKIDPSGNETVLSTFGSNVPGPGPSGGLILDEAGNLYGTTENGGRAGFGTVYELKP